MLFVSTEFIAKTRDAGTFLYETENKRTITGVYNKVCDCFRHHIFFFVSAYYRPENTGKHVHCFSFKSRLRIFCRENYCRTDISPYGHFSVVYLYLFVGKFFSYELKVAND